MMGFKKLTLALFLIGMFVIVAFPASAFDSRQEQYCEISGSGSCDFTLSLNKKVDDDYHINLDFSNSLDEGYKDRTKINPYYVQETDKGVLPNINRLHFDEVNKHYGAFYKLPSHWNKYDVDAIKIESEHKGNVVSEGSGSVYLRWNKMVAGILRKPAYDNVKSISTFSGYIWRFVADKDFIKAKGGLSNSEKTTGKVVIDGRDTTFYDDASPDGYNIVKYGLDDLSQITLYTERYMKFDLTPENTSYLVRNPSDFETYVSYKTFEDDSDVVFSINGEEVQEFENPLVEKSGTSKSRDVNGELYDFERDYKVSNYDRTTELGDIINSECESDFEDGNTCELNLEFESDSNLRVTLESDSDWWSASRTLTGGVVDESDSGSAPDTGAVYLVISVGILAIFYVVYRVVRGGK